MARAKKPVDALGKPLDPRATYVAVTGFASGYTVVSLVSRLAGNDSTVAKFSPNFIRDDEPGDVIASVRTARGSELRGTREALTRGHRFVQAGTTRRR